MKNNISLETIDRLKQQAIDGTNKGLHKARLEELRPKLLKTNISPDEIEAICREISTINIKLQRIKARS